MRRFSISPGEIDQGHAQDGRQKSKKASSLEGALDAILKTIDCSEENPLWVRRFRAVLIRKFFEKLQGIKNPI
jgi:hypothetical protein